MRVRPLASIGLILFLAAVLSAAAAEEGGKPPFYPWPLLDQFGKKFELIQGDAAPVIARLKEVRAQYLTAPDRGALLAERAGLRTKLGELLQEGEDVIERYRSTQKFIHVTALTRRMQLKGKSKKPARTATVLFKIMRYEENFKKMKKDMAVLYGEVSADGQEVARMQAQLSKEANFRLIVGVAGALVFVAFSLSYWITRRRTSVPTLEAVMYEEPAQLAAGGALAGPAVEPPRPQAEIPEILGGNFKVLKEIGRGGMGVVYEAMDLALRRKVAIKRMRSEVVQSDKETEQFLSEARLVASLKHPCLVEIFSILKEKDEIYLVFEFVEGSTLQQILDRKSKLPLQQANFILRQIAGALDYAHSQKVIHRDLKPSNVMITPNGVVKVMDFGIAYQAKKTAARMTRAEVWGTPPYMAPEQELGSISKESDIFSLGVCYYEMLTGKLPFGGPNFLAQKREMHYIAPSSATAGLPAGYDSVVRRALAAEVRERFHSGAEFVTAVAALA